MKTTLFYVFLLIPICALGQIALELDYAAFRYDDTQALAEIYYAVPIAGLKFNELPSGKIQAQVMIRATFEQNERIWKDESWKMEKTLNNISELNTADRMVDVLRFTMNPGIYKMIFYVEDLHNPENVSTSETMMDIADFSKQTLSTSYIQLASSIKKIEFDSTNVFWKNGVEIIPNPGAIYGKDTPILFYYLESYHIDHAVQGEFYKNRVQVVDANGAVVNAIRVREQQKKVINASVELGTINVSSLPTGVYNLEFAISDLNDAILHTTQKRFYFYNPDAQVTEQVMIEDIEAAVLRSEYAQMDVKQLDAEFEITRYFTTKDEKDFYKKIDSIEGKKRYIYRIWQARDPNPATEMNEFKMEYKRRIEEANVKFRSYSRKGWMTDRGRVYILYGPPTDVERNPNNPVSYAHEIWHYDTIEGGILFVFVDTQEFGEYAQIHSTKQGEPENNDWEEQIQKMR